MERFIRYLYEYENGHKTRNVGFVKVESDKDETTVYIQGKGLGLEKGTDFLLYLFWEKDGQCFGIFHGNIEVPTSARNCRFTYTREETGISDNYDKIAGILLRTSEGHQYVSFWKEDTPRIEQLKLWTPSNRQERKVTKIRRNDLANLPRCEWKLANNQFLVHGYYNYRHLAMIEEGNICKIGVPGIYHEKEAKAAEQFGFDEFLPKTKLEMELSEEEKTEDELFGYWCRQIKQCAGTKELPKME